MKSGDILASKYRLVQRIGEGAMGEVWAGENQATGGKVALKLIIGSAPQHTTPDLRQRLLREARACGKLAHRHIVQIFDVGETPEGDPFLVLELLRGTTLAERLKDTRRIEPALAARIGAEIASALAVAHGAKIVHRDLKPANVFLHREAGDPDDRFVVKVLDFGIAKNIDTNADGPATITNVALGSPVYMSPEQVGMQKDIDGRTDIWSLGIVLYEMLTGTRPFSGSVEAVLRQIVMTRIHKVPAPSTKMREIPPELDAIVARCLENNREHRVADASELAAALTAFAEAQARLRSSANFGKLIPADRPSSPASVPTTAPLSLMGPRGTLPLRERQTVGAPTIGPTGTAVLSSHQPVASPDPTWRKEMAAWRAQREATATVGAQQAPVHGGTQALDSDAVLSAMKAPEHTATTSAIGSMSQPVLAQPSVGMLEVKATSSRRKRNARLLFAVMALGVAAALLMVVIVVKAPPTDQETVRMDAPLNKPDAASNAGASATLPSPDVTVVNDLRTASTFEVPAPSPTPPPTLFIKPNPTTTPVVRPVSTPAKIKTTAPPKPTATSDGCVYQGATKVCPRRRLF